MTEVEKLQLIYEYYKGTTREYPDFENWLNKIKQQEDWTKEKIDMECQLAMYTKLATQNLKKMVQDNSYSLVKNGISEDKLDEIFSTKCYPCNMDSKVEQKVFLLETFKLFGIYDYETTIDDVKQIGEGDIYGYNVSINENEKYCIKIVKDKCEESQDGEELLFTDQCSKSFLNAQDMMLSKFENFSNSGTLSRIRLKIEKALLKENSVELK